jgi:hypothetical protein
MSALTYLHDPVFIEEYLELLARSNTSNTSKLSYDEYCRLRRLRREYAALGKCNPVLNYKVDCIPSNTQRGIVKQIPAQSKRVPTPWIQHSLPLDD